MKKWFKLGFLLCLVVPAMFVAFAAEEQASLHIDHSKYNLGSNLPVDTVTRVTAVILEGSDSNFTNVDLGIFGGKKSGDPMAIILMASAPAGFTWIKNTNVQIGVDEGAEVLGNLTFQAITTVVDSKYDAFASIEPNPPVSWIVRRFVNDIANAEHAIVMEYREPLAANLGSASTLAATPPVPNGFNERANKAFKAAISTKDTAFSKTSPPANLKTEYIQNVLPSLQPQDADSGL